MDDMKSLMELAEKYEHQVETLDAPPEVYYEDKPSTPKRHPLHRTTIYIGAKRMVVRLDLQIHKMVMNYLHNHDIPFSKWLREKEAEFLQEKDIKLPY